MEEGEFELPQTLDITSKEVDFNEMEQDIERFASEPSVREVLEVGVDLQNYNKDIQKELEIAELKSIDDYLRQIPRVERLHDEIASCDNILESMEDLLVQFKRSLGQLSSDMCNLQNQSQEITIKLNNRKALDVCLSEFTRNCCVTREFVDKITNMEVGPAYQQLVQELVTKIQFIQRKDICNSQAVQDAKVTINVLRSRATDHIRKWIISCVNELQSYHDPKRSRDNTKPPPRDKLSIQNAMMRCSKLFTFLKDNSPDVEHSTRQYYVDIVSQIYSSTFKSKTKKLSKQMAQISMSDETIVPSSQKGFFRTKKISSNESTLFFSLGDRQRLLNDALAPPQIFTEDSYPVEALVRSLYQSLIDDVTAEHVFASEFFSDENITAPIFAPTTKYLEGFMDDLIAKITDPVCVILLLRFAIAHKAEMERRKIFKIDQHLTSVQHKLSERFDSIIALNLAAIENADLRIFHQNEATDHYASAMARRFSEFSASLSQLMIDDISDMMTSQLHAISASVIDLLERAARGFKSPELSVIFLINNYYLILSTLQTINGCVLLELFQQKLNDCTMHFVDLELVTNFKKLVETVRQAFTKLESREEPLPIAIGESELKEIAVEFKENHVKKMKQIAESQIMKFDDFQNGMAILQLLAKRLVLYWAKFDQLCRSVVRGASPPWLVNMLSAQQLVCNIRPLTESF
ncbi:vacuolar protein sorting-associated protein 52 A [Histomonas meleagridis]|uniref:vacuolar protein sorting-associated protein 52 A n=1 Tax=Histomonas meleagridis TaxID=135588 RepID=UPI00355A7069|nr:vacuolar protein sorting-associated protein 52 A [Histomonas meleagridis]KAH0802143.1 vacuolar protein sorting-associated protein 52 A [Histomonas meleagridis]